MLLLGLHSASSAVSFSASAANAVTLKVGEATAQASESFTLDVSVKDVPATKINVLDFALSYDSSALTIESVKLGPAGDTASGDSTASEAPILSSKITTNAVNISWSTGLDSASWIAEEGVVRTSGRRRLHACRGFTADEQVFSMHTNMRRATAKVPIKP